MAHSHVVRQISFCCRFEFEMHVVKDDPSNTIISLDMFLLFYLCILENLSFSNASFVYCEENGLNSSVCHWIKWLRQSKVAIWKLLQILKSVLFVEKNANSVREQNFLTNDNRLDGNWKEGIGRCSYKKKYMKRLHPYSMINVNVICGIWIRTPIR